MNSIGKETDTPIVIPQSGPTMSSKDLDRLNDLYKKFPNLEKAIKEVSERVDTTENRLDAHDKNISDILKALKEKADISIKDEVDRLKSAIDDINRELGQFDTLRAEIEANKKRCEANDRNFATIEERLDMIKESMNERLREIENLLNSLKEDLLKLDAESNKQGGCIIKINQKIDIHEIKIDNLDKLLSSGFIGGGGFGSDNSGADTRELRNLFDQFKRDFLSFKEENYKRDKEIQEELNKKVDKADLVEFERLMRERMEATEKALQKAKTEFKKGLKLLDDKIRKVSDLPKSRGPSMDRDDAMLSKKPLEGFKCATCEKDLTNMIGLPAEFYNWKKMPRKEGERIPMMGQGFSRMLMTLNHNHSTTNLENRNSKTFYSPRKDDHEEVNESIASSRNEKARSSLIEKEGSTTIENSVLPQIKKKNKTVLK